MRKVIASIAVLATMFLIVCSQKNVVITKKRMTTAKPVVISTWNHGVPANKVAWEILSKGGSALDAVEQGVRTAEANPDVQTVGLGGFPDREGKVTLDVQTVGLLIEREK